MNQYRHYWFDWELKGFWPVGLAEVHGENVHHEPTATCAYNCDDAQEAAVLLGSADGHIRRYDHAVENDDGHELESFVNYGPLLMSRTEYRDAVMTELWATLARGSKPVAWAVHAAESNEAALDADARMSGTWTEGRNRNARVRVRGSGMMLKLAGAARWAVESIGAVVKSAGKTRVA